MKDIIESAFEDRNHLTPSSASAEVKDAVNEAIHLLLSLIHISEPTRPY